MSAAVDGLVATRVEVDEVDKQLTTVDTDEAVPVPGQLPAAVPRTHRQLSHVDHRLTLKHKHTHAASVT